jgi:hypothetical protein
VGENPGQRAANVYSAGGTTYSAPKYCASVGDALTQYIALIVHQSHGKELCVGLEQDDFLTIKIPYITDCTWKYVKNIKIEIN